MTWLGAAVIAIMAVAVWMFATAPTGYEDDDGFWYGEPPEDAE